MPEKFPVSVIMAVYNCQQYLEEAIDSILNQTFREFELIIVDDCSTDNTYGILLEYEKRDSRIRLRRLEKNSSQAVARNEGIKISSGKYLAFMDGDDISEPERLQVQYEFMELHPSIGVTTSNIVLFNNQKTNISALSYPQYDNPIKWALFFECSMVVGVSMMRRDIFDKPEIFRDLRKERIEYYPEDYDLWVRLAPATKFYNFRESLLKVRKHDSNITQTRITSNLFYFVEINQRYIESQLHTSVPKETIEILCNLGNNGNLNDAYKTMKELYAGFIKTKKDLSPEDLTSIREDISERLVNLFFRNKTRIQGYFLLIKAFRYSIKVPVKKITNYLFK